MQLVISHKANSRPAQSQVDLSRVVQTPGSLIRYFTDDTAASNYIESQTSRGFVCHTFSYGQSFQQKNIVQPFSLVA